MSLIRAIEKGMWAGWMVISLYAAASICLVHYAQINEGDMSITRKAYVDFSNSGLQVHAVDLGGVEPWWWFVVWCGFSALVVPGVTATIPYPKEPEFVPFKNKSDFSIGLFCKCAIVAVVYFFVWVGVFMLCGFDTHGSTRVGKVIAALFWIGWSVFCAAWIGEIVNPSLKSNENAT